MRRLSVALFVTVSAVCFSHLASAADLPVKAPIYKAPVAPPPYNWTGFYVGGNIGYSWGNVDSAFFSPDLPSIGLPATFPDTVKPQGVIGGGQIGYNWQASPNWVFGIETDFQGSGQKDSHRFTQNFTVVGAGPGTATVTHEEKLEWFGTVRGRIGYAFWDNVMLYGTGGLAYGQVSTAVAGFGGTAFASGGGSVSGSTTKVGWTVGGGVEGAIPNTRNWTWKIEYLYMDLGTANYTFSVPSPSGYFTLSNKITDNILRGGINYRF